MGALYLSGTPSTQTTGGNIAAGNYQAFAWIGGVKQRKLLIQNNTGSDLWFRFNQTTCAPTDADAIVVKNGESYDTDTFEYLGVCVYAVGAANLSGAGKNCTILSWSQVGLTTTLV